MGLSFSDLPERRALTTPRDFAALFPGSDGALYGRSPHGLMAPFRRCRARTTPAGPLPGGRRGAPGAGHADGGALRPARGRGDLGGPRFDLTVPPDGYAWWYVDGISDDGAHAVSVIGFIGSVFSPWYGWSGRRNPADHCCINVALYGRGGRWTMTDRGESALRQSPDTFEVGPSRDALGRHRADHRHR